MAISCVYCGGEHDSAAAVRQCWQDHEQPSVGPTDRHDAGDEYRPTDRYDPADEDGSTDESDDAPPLATDHTRPVARTPQPRIPALGVRRGVASAHAGPDTLGRHAIVSPAAEAPHPWTLSDRVVIDASVLQQPRETIRRLRTVAFERRRVVIELAVDFDHAPAGQERRAPHELEPSFSFELDDLWHLVWSNGVDLRRPDRPRWIGLDTAIAGGATPVTDGSADVVLASGEAVWIDGGPFRHTNPIDGVAVIPFASVEHHGSQPPGPNIATADLAPDQLAAVCHAGGAARIIAPAGSGKTRVLTERARHLLTNWHVPPAAVSLVAFNKRAQEEIAERTSDLPTLGIRTLNAIGLAIVNGTPPFAVQPRRWSTIDEIAVRRIIAKLVSFPRRRNADPVAPWIEALSVIRLGLVDPAEVEERYDGDVDGLAEMWPRYRAELAAAGAVDFDDQIYRAIEVLLTQPEARAAAQRACRVMLVDEFQDLTPAHVLMIRLLAAPGGAVFGVGDDDQTIYGYNGADPGWLIDYDRLFPGAGSHPLEVNYRCPAGIVDVVDRLLRHNTRRVPKTIRAASNDPLGWRVDDTADPVAGSLVTVRVAIDEGAAPSDVAVLTRVNALLAPVQVALTGADIPVNGGVGAEFLERTAIRTVLAWIVLATSGAGGPSRFAADDLREALRRPSRSFHPRISDWITEQGSLDDLERLAGRLNNEADAARVREFAADIAGLGQLARGGATTARLVTSLIDDVGLAGAVNTLDAHRRGMNRAAQGDDLTAITQLATLHDDPATFVSWLRQQLSTRRSPEGVVLATVHRVKGQEWPHVIVHLADAEQYPHRLADDVEEERRLFHVAITRASRAATIISGPNPSPFIAELTTEPERSAEVTLHTSPTTRRSSPATEAKAKAGDPQADLDDRGRALYAALVELRNELRDGKPAYVVFDNKTAVEIARAAPTTLAELARVRGIGPTKLDTYGAQILAVVNR